MKITLAQQNYLVADVSGNTAKIIETVKQSQSPVVIFPEGAITGTPLYELNFDEMAMAACEEIAKIAPEKEIFIGLGTFQIAYITGGEVQIVDNNAVELDGAFIIFETNHFSHHLPEQKLEEVREMAQENTIVLINQVGASTDTVYYGGSVVCYPSGETIAFPLWEECVRTIDTQIPENDIADWGSNVEQTHQAILLAIRDYFRKNSFNEACVALSGGIDSAIVVALAVEALGADRVRVVLLPSAYSSDHSVEDSLEMARRCGIRHDTINIEPIFAQALSSLEQVFDGTESGVAEENMQSRIRLMLTMAISNKTGALMLNTSNKSEVAVGYGTLYGDTSGALGVISDLYKTEVYELANHINTVSGNLIPQNIIDKEPSAELRPNQRDTDSLPPYDVLDAVLFRLIEQQMSIAQVVAAGYPEEHVIRAARLLWNGDFKRKQLPPAIRLSGATFGVEYVMPITKARNI